MPTIAVIPITMPSTVNPERILLVRTVSNAITTTSLNRSRRAAVLTLFAPQRFNWIQARRPRRRIQAEEESHECGDADAECHRPHFDRGRNGRRLRNRQRDGAAEDGADDAAKHREDDRLCEHLRH